MKYATYLIYVILYEGFFVGGTGYVVFWMGYSGWWFVLAVLFSAGIVGPMKWIHGVDKDAD